MSEWQNLALAVLVVVAAELGNEVTIYLFRVRNATTRFRIRLISFFSCFFVFLIVPLKMVELIVSKEAIVTGSSSYLWIARDAVVTSHLSGFAWFSLILVILAAFCFLVTLFFSNRIVPLLLRCQPASDRRLLSAVKKVSKELNVKVDKVVICVEKCDAFVFGHPPTLAVGRDLLDIVDDKELRIIIKHELCHIKGKDTVLKPFFTSLCIIFLYNPMIWFLFKRLFNDRESCADQAAITSTQDTKVFVSLILKVHDLTCGKKIYAPYIYWMGATYRIDSLLCSEKTRKIPVMVCLLFTLSSLYVGGTQLFQERYIDIEASDFPVGMAASQVAGISTHFSDSPVEYWYSKIVSEREEGVPLRESEFIELLKASTLPNGQITIRLATLPLGSKGQFFWEDSGPVVNRQLILNKNGEGKVLVLVKGVPEWEYAKKEWGLTKPM